MYYPHLGLLLSFLLFLLQHGSSAQESTSPLPKLEFSKIQHDKDGGYRVFVNSTDKEILQTIKLDAALIKEIYLQNPKPEVLEQLEKYQNLECVDISAMQQGITGFEFLAKLSKLKTLGIHTTAVKIPNKAILPKMEKLESIYIDCVMTENLELKELASNYPNAKAQLFRCCNDKDLASKQMLSVLTNNHYIVVHCDEKTPIQAYVYGKEYCGYVIANLKKYDHDAIQGLADICELRQVGIESLEIKYAHFQDILKNKTIKNVKIRKSSLSEAEFNLLRQEHPNITFTK